MFKSFIIGLTTVAAVGLAAVAGIPQASAADPCTNGNLDNCYTKAQMKDFLAVIDKMVLGYMDKIGVPEDSLPTVVYVPEGEIETTECVTSSDGSHDETDEAYAYCASDNKIFIGQSQLWSFYQDYGAVGPTTGLAHEYGHFLQALTGVPQPESNKDSITHENQADCISGSFVSYLDDKGDVDYPGDYKNLAGLAFEIASAEGPNRDHGTVDERVGSFVIGFYGDLSACNEFYPDAPLTS